MILLLQRSLIFLSTRNFSSFAPFSKTIKAKSECVPPISSLPREAPPFYRAPPTPTATRHEYPGLFFLGKFGMEGKFFFFLGNFGGNALWEQNALVGSVVSDSFLVWYQRTAPSVRMAEGAGLMQSSRNVVFSTARTSAHQHARDAV